MAENTARVLEEKMTKSAMKKSQERLGAIDYEEAEEARLKVFKADKKNFLPDAELKELRRMAEQL